MLFTSDELIDLQLLGETPDDIVETVMRPRRRFHKGSRFSYKTGKMKDPRRRRLARMTFRKHKAKTLRKMQKGAKRWRRKSTAKRFFKKLGRLTARLRRR